MYEMYYSYDFQDQDQDQERQNLQKGIQLPLRRLQQHHNLLKTNRDLKQKLNQTKNYPFQNKMNQATIFKCAID